MSTRRRYAVVGLGGRAVCFLDAIVGNHRANCELVGFCDPSATRMNWHNQRLKNRFQHAPVPSYGPKDFEAMIGQERVETVLVTTMDCLHHEYIIRAMEQGCDVICEKPMTIDAEKIRAIFDAIQRTGRKLRVTFNYRYQPYVTRLRQLVADGVVGRPLAVDFSWVLDTRHGADYFRRWHREKRNSGGLLVHKATHHFDLINWWIDSYPQTVYAMGDLKFYGKQNAAARGKTYPYDRYTGHPEAKQDPFALFLNEGEGPSKTDTGAHNQSTLRGLYLEAEADSGYIRDRNVFGEPIDIEDTMAVTARYRNGVILNYSLIAYCPWEGFQVAVTGDRGRLEYREKHGSHIITGQNGNELSAEQAKGAECDMRVFPMFGESYPVEVIAAAGGHGGGDPIMLEQIFSSDAPPDPHGRAASHIDGAASILMGISANQSIMTGQPVQVDDLVKLPSPDS